MKNIMRFYHQSVTKIATTSGSITYATSQTLHILKKRYTSNEISNVTYRYNSEICNVFLSLLF